MASSSARKRTRPLGSSELALTNPNSSSLALLASSHGDLDAIDEPLAQRSRRDVLTTQLETLQATLDHERQLRDLDKKKFSQTQQRLERKLQFAMEEAQEAKTLMDDAALQHETFRQKLVTENARLQAELQRQFQRMEDLSRPKEDTAQTRMIQRLEEQLEAAQQENESLQRSFQQFRQMADRPQQPPPPPQDENQPPPASPAVQMQLNQTKVQLAEAERKVRQYQRLEKDILSKTKELTQQQEKSRSATKRVQQVERELQERLAAMALIQAKLDTWQDFGAQLTQLLAQLTQKSSSASVPLPPTKTASGVPPEVSLVQRYLQEATREAKQANEQASQLQEQLQKATEQVQTLEHSQREAQALLKSKEVEYKDVQQQLQVAESKFKGIQDQERIWKRELESLRSIVKTFDELPLDKNPPLGATPSKTQTMLQTRCDALVEEKSVLQSSQQKLQTQLDAALQAKATLQTQHTTVLEKFEKLKSAVYTERAKAEQATAQAVHAEELAGKGSFNPATTRVVHLQRNPLTEALQEEVGVLKRQVAALSSHKPSRKTSMDDVDPNKLHQRLKESFKEQIARFREGVYLLTGFKIDMIPDGEQPKFKVRSMFAEQEQDHLLFQWPTGTPVESLDLLDTELAKWLTTTPSYAYIQRFHSMPAFLASTQLSLFEKQTMI
eukprot:Nitzschia sp. Nitz4//scaffold61_size107673//84740//86752//NITZ4_004250-RA/size107673-processed-gene-0.197-mRNA-1//-1//CDS//3329555755//5423//frame0